MYMSRADRLKEEIGWLKVVFGIAVALDASLVAWLAQNYATASPIDSGSRLGCCAGRRRHDRTHQSTVGRINALRNWRTCNGVDSRYRTGRARGGTLLGRAGNIPARSRVAPNHALQPTPGDRRGRSEGRGRARLSFIVRRHLLAETAGREGWQRLILKIKGSEPSWVVRFQRSPKTL
jgi:hypothetical protein